ncbi:hypothetical protein HDE_12677 [Halotydeus destructor]|nr:hypothetical protein HDE_12677 [Halotydeus destructor]
MLIKMAKFGHFICFLLAVIPDYGISYKLSYSNNTRAADKPQSDRNPYNDPAIFSFTERFVTKMEGDGFVIHCDTEVFRTDGKPISKWAGKIHGLQLYPLTLADKGTYRCRDRNGQYSDIVLRVEMDPRKYPLPKCDDRTEFTCGDGQCIDLKLQCNGNRDCSNGNDERQAPCEPDSEPDELENEGYDEDEEEYDRGLDQDGNELPSELECPDTPQTAIEGQDVVFRCRDRLRANVGLEWYKQKTIYEETYTTRQEADRMVILNAQISDSGIYVCRVRGSDVLKLNVLNVVSRNAKRPRSLQSHG